MIVNSNVLLPRKIIPKPVTLQVISTAESSMPLRTLLPISGFLHGPCFWNTTGRIGMSCMHQNLMLSTLLC